MKTILKPITFETWQDLAKAVMDCRNRKIFFSAKNEIGQNQAMNFKRIKFNGAKFGYEEPSKLVYWRDCNIYELFSAGKLFSAGNFIFAEEFEVDLRELIKIKPRLCRVWDHEGQEKRIVEIVKYIDNNDHHYYTKTSNWRYAELLTDEEIKKYLDEE